VRHDCGEKRGGRTLTLCPPLRIPRGVRCAVGRTDGEKAPLRAQPPIARRSRRGRQCRAAGPQRAGLSRRKGKGSRLTLLAINSYFGSSTGRSAQKVATPQTRAQKKKLFTCLHVPFLVPLMFHDQRGSERNRRAAASLLAYSVFQYYVQLAGRGRCCSAAHAEVLWQSFLRSSGCMPFGTSSPEPFACCWAQRARCHQSRSHVA